MDIDKFELTDKEMAEVNGDKEACLAIIQAFDTCEGCSASCRAIAKAQVAKVLSLLEPVELEALGDEETDNLRVPPNELWNYKEHIRRASQATIRHNQSKGQLLRLKEE